MGYKESSTYIRIIGMKNKALLLTTIATLSIGIMYCITMIFSSNGGISSLPTHSRLADINLYHEGWIETCLFLSIGLYGLYTLYTNEHID